MLPCKSILPSPAFPPPSPHKREPRKSDGSLNTENIPRWQTPPQQSPLKPHASLAKCDITTGRVPCLNQSNDLASLDLSVLFLILPVNTSASTGPPCSKLVGLLYCGALQCNPAKNKICTNTKGSFSMFPPPAAPFFPFSSSSWFQSFNMNLGMLAMQTAQFLTEFSQIYLIDNSV